MPNPLLPKKELSAHPAFKLLISIIVIVALYTNLAIILSFTIYPVTLPINKFAKAIFNVYAVFSNYITMNRDFIIMVLVEDQHSRKQNVWVQIDTYEFFPFKKGSQSSRFLTLMHSIKLEKKQQHDAYRFLAQKIKERYNRLHAGKKAIGIKLVMQTWPTSRKSYYDQKILRLTKFYTIYEDLTE